MATKNKAINIDALIERPVSFSLYLNNIKALTDEKLLTDLRAIVKSENYKRARSNVVALASLVQYELERRGFEFDKSKNIYQDPRRIKKNPAARQRLKATQAQIKSTYPFAVYMKTLAGKWSYLARYATQAEAREKAKLFADKFFRQIKVEQESESREH